MVLSYMLLPNPFLVCPLSSSTDRYCYENLGDMDSIGGVLCLELVEFPAPPTVARGWQMREVIESLDTVQVKAYPASSTDNSAPTQVRGLGKMNWGG